MDDGNTIGLKWQRSGSRVAVALAADRAAAVTEADKPTRYFLNRTARLRRIVLASSQHGRHYCLVVLSLLTASTLLSTK